MSARGGALLQVAAGLPEVLSCPAVAEFAETLWIRDRAPIAVGGLRPAALAAAAAGARAAAVELDGIAWAVDEELIAAAPAAVWTLAMSADTSCPGLWLGYSPATGLVEAIDGAEGPAVPLAWALPGAPPEHAAALQRVISAVAAFDAAAAAVDPLLHDPARPDPAAGGAHGR